MTGFTRRGQCWVSYGRIASWSNADPSSSAAVGGAQFWFSRVELGDPLCNLRRSEFSRAPAIRYSTAGCAQTLLWAKPQFRAMSGFSSSDSALTSYTRTYRNIYFPLLAHLHPRRSALNYSVSHRNWPEHPSGHLMSESCYPLLSLDTRDPVTQQTAPGSALRQAPLHLPPLPCPSQTS